MAHGFCLLILQVFLPYNPLPERPTDPPDSQSPLEEETVQQCQKIYDDAEDSRKYLEDKARATFTMTAFLAPLLVSAFLFLLNKAAPSWHTTLANYLASAAGIFLFLGFVSTVRAVGVHQRTRLLLGAVLDVGAKQFRKYDAGFHAQGLLYCASVNHAMNAHVAQFVKGAQVFTALAVILACAAAVPLTHVYATAPQETTHTKVEGSVNINSSSLDTISSKLDQLSADLRAAQNRADLTPEIAKLEMEITALRARIKHGNPCTEARQAQDKGLNCACMASPPICRQPN